jgi:hypothetical protein
MMEEQSDRGVKRQRGEATAQRKEVQISEDAPIRRVQLKLLSFDGGQHRTRRDDVAQFRT